MRYGHGGVPAREVDAAVPTFSSAWVQVIFLACHVADHMLLVLITVASNEGKAG